MTTCYGPTGKCQRTAPCRNACDLRVQQNYTSGSATMAVPTAEGMLDAMEALQASCEAGKWTLIAPDGRVWMNADPMILFAALDQVMQGNPLRFGDH